MGKTNTPADVFKYIDTHDNDPNVCWEWTGALGGRDGRGYFVVEGKRYMAHRLVYMIFNGDIPEKMVVRHKCDNAQCCNPMHLELGTKSDNELDKYRRGRAGLPMHIINEINRLLREYKRNGLDIQDKQIRAFINEKFKVDISLTSVGRVRRGERRKEQSDSYKKEADNEEGK